MNDCAGVQRVNWEFRDYSALVTSDPVKATELSKMCGVEKTYDYEQVGELISSGTVDALYITAPNWRHAQQPRRNRPIPETL